LHETVAVPDPIRLAGLIGPQVRPDGTISVRLTVPPKWLALDIVIVDVPDEPTLIGAGVDASIPKSRNWKKAVALCTRELLVAVMVRV
jgi:hypothetical protein